jgi:hypothetical protein
VLPKLTAFSELVPNCGLQITTEIESTDDFP